jgi:hypothetical protein
MLSLANHHCAGCDRPIGLFDPIRVELDGECIEAASVLDLATEQLPAGVRLWHRECGPTAGPRAWSQTGWPDHSNRRP